VRRPTLDHLSDDATIKRVNFELSAKHHAKLKIHAVKQGKSIKELLTDYIIGLPDGSATCVPLNGND
jgi:hypothetical protein